MQTDLVIIIGLFLILFALQHIYYLQNKKRADNKTTTDETPSDITKEEALEAEIVKLKGIVEDTKKVAQEATIIKSDFLTNIRHEIRTPMNAILVFSEMIQKESRDSEIASYAKDIHYSGNNLLHLLNNIIEMSEIDSGYFEISTSAIDLKEFIDRAIEVHKVSSSKKGLNFIVEIDKNLPESIMIDTKRVLEILDNLLENALNFTKKGEIKFRVSLNNLDEGKNEADISFSVKDTGIGISKINQEKIFKIFENREAEDKTEYQTSGLSLSLNKKLATMMDGSLDVESELNHGSTFTLRLQMVEVVLLNKEYDIKDESLDFSSIKQGSVIVVIDEAKKTLDLVKKSFHNTDVEVFAHASLKDAMTTFQNKKIDLVLIDIDILSIDDNAVGIVIKQLTQAPIVGLVDERMDHVSFHEYGAKPVANLKKPLNKVDLFRIALRIINAQKTVVENGEIQELQLEEGLNFEASKDASIEYFKNSSSEVNDLLQKSLDTNDLGTIESFTHKIKDLSQVYGIESLSLFAKELLARVDSFDIQGIDSMLKEYESKSKAFRSVYIV